jgi:hypothetical protein
METHERRELLQPAERIRERFGARERKSPREMGFGWTRGTQARTNTNPPTGKTQSHAAADASDAK